MTQAVYQTIKAGFKTDEDLQQALQALHNKGFMSVKATSPKTSASSDVPKERNLKSGTPKAAIAGGLLGAIIAAMMTAIAFNIPNLPSIQANTIPFAIGIPLGGAIVGAAAGGLLSFLSGAAPKPLTAERQIIVDTPAEGAELARKILLEQKGYLL